MFATRRVKDLQAFNLVKGPSFASENRLILQQNEHLLIIKFHAREKEKKIPQDVLILLI